MKTCLTSLVEEGAAASLALAIGRTQTNRVLVHSDISFPFQTTSPLSAETSVVQAQLVENRSMLTGPVGRSVCCT